MDRFGRYELLFEIGVGGMARVYLARQLGDSGFERLVAIKRVHAHLVGDPDIYSMVSDEARIAALLRHPNVAAVVDVVDRQGELLLVLDYVEGFALSKLCRRTGKGLPPALASRVVIDGLAGLHAAHEARDLLGERLDVVHRDVSPQNLLVGVDGVTRVIDFGIARARGNATLTQTGVVKGKVAYMAPERLDEREVDRRADLFAMGAVMNELLLGAAARADGDEARDLARAMLSTFDSSAVARVAPRLAPVLERALARSPSDRFASAEEMARAIAAAEPPAPPTEVSAWVASIEESAIAERRARIASAIEAAVPDDLTADVAAGGVDVAPDGPSPSPSAAVVPARQELVAGPATGAAPRRSSLWVAALAALVAANVGAWVVLRQPGDRREALVAVTSAGGKVGEAAAGDAATGDAAARDTTARDTATRDAAAGDRSTARSSTVPVAPVAPPPGSARASDATSAAPPSVTTRAMGPSRPGPSAAPSASATSALQANPYASH